MIDIHNHLLYGIDDGSLSLEDSIDVLKDLEKCGYIDIILTPHYITCSRYTSSKKDNLNLLEKLKKEVKKNKININLYLGNEIFMDDDIVELLKRGIISSLNDTKYLLIELPMNGEYPNYQEVFSFIQSKGYKVILAHPERYLSFQEDFDLIYELKDMGLYFQCNLESIIGRYGSHAKKVITRMLKENMVSYLATDIHHKKSDYSTFSDAKKEILKYISEEEFDKLTKDNPKKLLS